MSESIRSPRVDEVPLEISDAERDTPIVGVKSKNGVTLYNALETAVVLHRDYKIGPLNIVRFRDHFDPDGRQDQISWDDLKAMLADAPKVKSREKRPALKLARLGDNRKKGSGALYWSDNLEGFSGVLLDNDNGLDADGNTMPMERAAELLRENKVECCLYSTPKNDEANGVYKWRLVIPFSREHEADPEDFLMYVGIVNAITNGLFTNGDQQNWIMTMKSSYGQVPPSEYKFIEVKGYPLDGLYYEGLTPEPLYRPNRLLDAGTNFQNEYDLREAKPEEIREVLALLNPSCSRDDWLKAGMALHDGFKGEDEGLAFWDEWSQASDKYQGLDDLRTRWVSFGKSEGGKVSFGTLLRMAREAREIKDEPKAKEIYEEVLQKISDLTRKSDIFSIKEALEPAAGLPKDMQESLIHLAYQATGMEKKLLGSTMRKLGPDLSVVKNSNLPQFEMDRNGGILPKLSNVHLALKDENFIGWRIRYDGFVGDIELAPVSTEEWRRYQDEDLTVLRLNLERRGFSKTGKDDTREALRLVARENLVDTAQLWLGSLSWDGQERIGTFASQYLGTENTEYTRAVSEYLWTALAGRGLEPGCKADMMPILQGPQGAMKSSSVNALVPDKYFKELNLGDRNADLSRLLPGTLVVEVPELQGLKTRDLESLKAFITKKTENWIPKYKEQAADYARRCILIGTTNEDEFLADPTGERRFLPMRVTKCDPAAIERDRDQMWAEAVVKFRKEGVLWKDAERLAKAEHVQFKVADSWEEPISIWLSLPYDDRNDVDMTADLINYEYEGPRKGDIPFTSREVMLNALKLNDDRGTKANEARVVKVLNALGYEKGLKKETREFDKMRGRFWRKPAQDSDTSEF